jgi:hypothetical protein
MRVGRGYRGKKAQPVDLEPKYPGKYVCRYNCVLYLEVIPRVTNRYYSQSRGR